MKNKFNHIILILLLIITAYSCSDNTFELPDYKGKVVVDGWIEQGSYPQVLLTLSAPYFSDIDSASLRELVITQAKVTVSSSTFSEILTLKPNHTYFPPYVYCGTQIKGELGETYTLMVNYRGDTITSETTIPELTKLDSVWFELDKESTGDTTGYIWISFTEPIPDKNYYRIYTQRKGIDNKYIPIYFPNIDDKFFNEEKIKLKLLRGNENPLDNEDILYFNVKDTVFIKFCSIDKKTYDFWETFKKEQFNAGNPLAASNSKIKSNITNGLGVWGGYAVAYYQFVINQKKGFTLVNP